MHRVSRYGLARGYEPARRAGFAMAGGGQRMGVARTPACVSRIGMRSVLFEREMEQEKAKGRTVRVATPSAGAGLRRLAGVGGTCAAGVRRQSWLSAGEAWLQGWQ